ncbi:H-2 class II histocompatibility antigen, I-E beta chain-like, partial [Anoplopoma fimbria]|uniref:H-2 class II histocompatibility antigen, I-E beta chain-like n=1 Tax=Anoplopoma fimbria TaxID=229290 RepID=UPI0023EA80E6
MASSFLLFSLLFIGLHAADGFMQARVAHCVFNSSDPKDIEFIDSYYYNKLEYIRFSSSVGKFVGFTEHGVKNAAAWNNDPSILAQMKAEKERYCVRNIQIDYDAALTKS